MSKFSKEELTGRINELELDDDIKISLMEDISDSFVDDDKIKELETKLAEKQGEVEELKNKYKERFLTSDNKTDKKEDVSTDEVVDIRSLF